MLALSYSTSQVSLLPYQFYARIELQYIPGKPYTPTSSIPASSYIPGKPFPYQFYAASSYIPGKPFPYQFYAGIELHPR